MRARLAASARPERIFQVTVAAARQAGLVGVRRVLDSTPLYDAVATMDTVTLLGAAIRGVLKVADEPLAAEARGGLPAARIARKVAADRVISTIDPDARHGHKTSARSFDGYKGHASVDPDSELVMATAATAGNVGDAAPAAGLLAELVAQVEGGPPALSSGSAGTGSPLAPNPTVYGDSASGTGPLLASLHAAGAVTCPAQRTAPIVYSADPRNRHHGQASFGPACTSCPLRGQCTSAVGAAPSPSPPTSSN